MWKFKYERPTLNVELRTLKEEHGSRKTLGLVLTGRPVDPWKGWPAAFLFVRAGWPFSVGFHIFTLLAAVTWSPEVTTPVLIRVG